MDANHRQMARCSDRTDARYRAILGVLKQFMRSGENSRALTKSTLKSGANVRWPYADSVSDLLYRGAATNQRRFTSSRSRDFTRDHERSV
jgi:hypothetical protein